MRAYVTKKELIEEIQKSFAKYEVEFDEIPESKKEVRVDAVDKTPAENLAYQLGWTTLLLQWEVEEQAGKQVITPKEGYKWNQLGDLYQTFYTEYETSSLLEKREKLTQNVAAICLWIASLSDEELFEPGQRKWATTKAAWPVYKWIHINTVAPFTTFRTEIRKWKKIAL